MPGKYGRFWGGGLGYGAHRLSFELSGSEIPDGYYVCHHCDNPPCCNPSHLYAGTAKDNARDKADRGRQDYGERISACVLTELDVLAIRDECAVSDSPFCLLAERYGVSEATISYIARGETWQRAGGPRSRRQSAVILDHNGESLPVAEWARRTGISDPTIRARLSRGCTAAEALAPVVKR